jgi:hypothetical protein
VSVPPLVTLPTPFCPSSAVLTLRSVVSRTVSPYTLQEQAFKWAGEQWTIDVQLAPIKGRENAAKWQAFGLSLQGGFGYFLMGDPLGKQPRGSAGGTPLVNGAGQTGDTLQTDGWPVSTAGILLAGDYIQIGTGIEAQLYMILEDANSDSGGNSILRISPSLRGSPSDNAAIITSNPQGLFRMNSNDFSWSVAPGQIYTFSFRAVEVINA